MKITVDRLEHGVAVCELEDGTFADLPAEFLPAGTREGSKLLIELDPAAEEESRARIQAKLSRLFGKRNS